MINYFQVIYAHLMGMGFNYILKAPLLLSHCGFFIFGCRLSFLVGLSLFVDGYSAVSCDFGVFMRGGELKSFYSAILSPTRGIHILLFIYLFNIFIGV